MQIVIKDLGILFYVKKVLATSQYLYYNSYPITITFANPII